MNLKSLLFKEEDTPQQKPSSKVEEKTAEKSAEASSGTPVSFNATEDSKQVEQMMQKLSDVIKENNQPGFDYYEFHDAVKKLIQKGQAEDSAYNAVYSTVETMGVTRASLMKSGEFYLSVLEKESADFDTQIKQQEKQNIVDKEKEIADLTKQIELMKKRKEQLEKEVIDFKSKVNILKFAFTEAYSKITTTIKEEIAKISSYIIENKGGK